MTPERYQTLLQSIEQHGHQGFEVELIVEIGRLRRLFEEVRKAWDTMPLTATKLKINGIASEALAKPIGLNQRSA